MTRGRASVPTVFFITHPNVAIDPAVAIPDWPLDARGRERIRAIAALPWARGVRRVFASSERKTRDGAKILAAGLGLVGYGIVAAPGEADRSATGYLPKQEFEAAAQMRREHAGVERGAGFEGLAAEDKGGTAAAPGERRVPAIEPGL